MPVAPIAAGLGAVSGMVSSNNQKNAQKADSANQSQLDQQLEQIYQTMLTNYNQISSATNPTGLINSAAGQYSQFMNGTDPGSLAFQQMVNGGTPAAQAYQQLMNGTDPSSKAFQSMASGTDPASQAFKGLTTGPAAGVYQQEAVGGLSDAAKTSAENQQQLTNARGLSSLVNQLGPSLPNVNGAIKDYQENAMASGVNLNQQLAAQDQGVRAAGAAGLSGLQTTQAGGLAGLQNVGAGGLGSNIATGAGGSAGLTSAGASGLGGLESTGASGTASLGSSILQMLQQIMGQAAGGISGVASQYGAADTASGGGTNPFASFMNTLAANPNLFNSKGGGIGVPGGLATPLPGAGAPLIGGSIPSGSLGSGGGASTSWIPSGYQLGGGGSLGTNTAATGLNLAA